MGKSLIALLLLIYTGIYAQKINVYGIGDSTMADKINPSINPERGWLQVFPQFVTPDVEIVNKAVNGRSTRSFIDEGRWESIVKVLKPGDYVFIQFGHNDQKSEDPKRYTNPHTAYRQNLMRFVTETRQKGATPVLFTSIVRRNFNEHGVLIGSHGDYTAETRQVATEMDVLLIDLEYFTELLEQSYGPDRSKELHLHYKRGEIAYYPDGKSDDTHLSIKGATEIARIVAREFKKANIGLGNYCK